MSGHNKGHLGHHHTDETKALLHNLFVGVGHSRSLATREKISRALSGVPKSVSRSVAMQEQVRAAVELAWREPSLREQARQRSLLRWSDPLFHDAVKLKLGAEARTPERRRQQREIGCRNWENPEYRKRVCKRRAMSTPEIRFASLVQEHNLPYRFVGNGDLWLGRRNPDFVHLSEPRLIEIWGDYYHKGQNPEDRVAYFEKYGYSTLVIWASELCKPDTLEKVLTFGGQYDG